jgi:hypothetical protein
MRLLPIPQPTSQPPQAKEEHHTNPSPDLESSLTKLSINPQPSKSSPAFRKKQHTHALADSWEDADDDDDAASTSGSDTDRGPLTPSTSASYPSAPPPTPISAPSHHDSFISPYGYGEPAKREREREVRPEKTDAVAKRMIAGALGVRAPKKTEEQRDYERAVKEKEIRKRREEKEALARKEEEREKAKAAVWED